MKSIFTLLIALHFTSAAWSWGGRAHHAICDAAVQLVTSTKLKDFLATRPHVMGHLCNVPDIHWRNIGPSAKVGDATHFFEPDLVGVSLQAIPPGYKLVQELLKDKPIVGKNTPLTSVPDQVGSLWWRADQFYRLTLEHAKKIATTEAPKNRNEEQDHALAYNKHVFHMMTYMGIMGHFTADATMPLHNAADYDGWHSGHGGIHNYYEEQVVGHMSGDLVAKILRAQKQDFKKYKFLKTSSVVEAMKLISSESYNEKDKMLRFDKKTTPSKIEVVDGKESRKAATRPHPKDNVANYEHLILSQLARAASLTAYLWELSYKQAGEPDLSHYKSYRFPFQPEFVTPDYFNN